MRAVRVGYLGITLQIAWATDVRVMFQHAMATEFKLLKLQAFGMMLLKNSRGSRQWCGDNAKKVSR